jgi:hypothetical protein
MGETSFSLFSAWMIIMKLFFFFFFCLFVLAWVCKLYLKCQKIKPTMGQKKLKTGLGFETLAQTRNRANNGPKKRGPTMGLNELGPLNIYLKLEIGPTMD